MFYPIFRVRRVQDVREVQLCRLTLSPCNPVVDCAQDVRGAAPRYDDAARTALRSALFAARHALADSAGPLADARSGANLLPAALMGHAGGARRGLDLSGFHTAVLWAGSALAGAALVRGVSLLGQKLTFVTLNYLLQLPCPAFGSMPSSACIACGVQYVAHVPWLAAVASYWRVQG